MRGRRCDVIIGVPIVSHLQSVTTTFISHTHTHTHTYTHTRSYTYINSNSFVIHLPVAKGKSDLNEGNIVGFPKVNRHPLIACRYRTGAVSEGGPVVSGIRLVMMVMMMVIVAVVVRESGDLVNSSISFYLFSVYLTFVYFLSFF